MLKMKMLLLLLILPGSAFACLFRTGTYKCGNFPITDIGKRNVFVREIVISKKGTTIIATWNATGDVWIQDSETAGHFETLDFQYIFNLKLGKTYETSGVYNNVVCERYQNPAGTAIFFSKWVESSIDPSHDTLISLVQFSQSEDKPKQLSVSIVKRSESFNCSKQ